MKTFASLAIAVAALTTICSVGASANPLTDSDNDGVFDEEPDHCPNTPGDRLNNGCPSNAEVVIVTGRPLNGGAGWIMCPDGTLSAHWNTCPTYSAGWGTFHVVHFTTPGQHSHTETLADRDGDGVLDAPDQCPDQQGPDHWNGCPATVYCAQHPNMYELDCYKWGVANLDLYDLGAYLEDFQSFVEGGCANDFYHWACFLHNRYLRPSDPWASLVRWTDRWSRTHMPPTCPEHYHALSSTSLFGGFEFPVYTGSCMNDCRALLFQAGMLSTVLGPAGQVAKTAAARTLITSSGILSGGGSSVAAIVEICSGPAYVDGTYD